MTDDQLRTLRTSCRQVLQSVVTRLNERPDIQDEIGRLMGSVEIVDELIAINSESPSLAWMLLQASVAELVKSQSVEAIGTELKRRATPTN